MESRVVPTNHSKKYGCDNSYCDVHLRLLTFSALPDELVMKILSFLHHKDLGRMCLISKRIKNLANAPVLWSTYLIQTKHVSLMFGLTVLLKVIKLPKFRKLQVLDLNGVLSSVRKKKSIASYETDSQSFQQFMNILSGLANLPLKSLDLGNNELGYALSGDALIQNLVKIQHVGLYGSFRHRIPRSDSLSGPMLLNKILTGITNFSVLRSIDLGACRLETVPVATIVYLNALSSVSLNGSFVTLNQARALLMKIADGSSKIVNFHLGRESIIDVETESDVLQNLEPELVAEALNMVKYLSYNKIICNNGECKTLEPDIHLEKFLEVMGKKTNLTRIEMDKNIYHHVSPAIISKALNNIKHLELLPDSCIQTSHMVAIFKLMAKQTNIEKLIFARDDISRLCPHLMSKAIANLEQADLLCKMSLTRAETLLSHLNSSSKIKRLNLGPNDISKIPEQAVENAAKVLKSNGGSVVFISRKNKKFMSYCYTK